MRFRQPTAIKYNWYSIKILGVKLVLRDLKLVLLGVKLKLFGLKIALRGLKLALLGVKLKLFGLKIALRGLKLALSYQFKGSVAKSSKKSILV